MTETRDERPRRLPIALSLIAFAMGFLFLAIGFNRPSIANMRTVDLIHLVATGGCLGAGLVALMQNIFGRRDG